MYNEKKYNTLSYPYSKDKKLHDECELIKAIDSIYEKYSGDINTLIAQFNSN